MGALKGIDISEFQGNVEFDKVKESGIQFVILRDGYGQMVDACFRNYVKNAQKAGLKISGVYHFSYALDVEQAKKEAEFCLKEVKEAGLPSDTIIFFDFESSIYYI